MRPCTVWGKPGSSPRCARDHVMHEFRNFQLSSIYYNNINMDQIELALQDLSLQDKPNIAVTAEKFQVNRSTLSRRFNGVSQSQAVANQNRGLLSGE